MSNNTTELNLLNTTESELATKTNPISTIISGLTIEYDDIESDELKWDTTINQIASEPITDYNYTLEELQYIFILRIRRNIITSNYSKIIISHIQRNSNRFLDSLVILGSLPLPKKPTNSPKKPKHIRSRPSHEANNSISNYSNK